MAVPVMTFSDPMVSRPRQVLPTALEGLTQGVGQGINMADVLQKMHAASAMSPLKQQLMSAQTQAQLAKANQARLDPYAGKILPGPAGVAQGMDIMKHKYGEGSPQYNMALKSYNAALKLQLGRAAYFTANSFLKNMPEINKMQVMENYQNEQKERMKEGLPKQTIQEWHKALYVHPHEKMGFPSQQPPSPALPQPTGQVVGSQDVDPITAALRRTMGGPGMQQPQEPVGQAQAQPPPQVPAQAGQAVVPPSSGQLSPEHFGFESRQTGLAEVQKTVSSFLRQKLYYGNNIEKTIRLMPESAIADYSENPKKLFDDYKKSLDGKQTPAYSRYTQYVTNARLLATQLRQFYGDSISPGARNDLAELSNPISWRTSPKASLIKFRTVKQNFVSELNTAKRQAVDPTAFQPRGTVAQALSPVPAVTAALPKATNRFAKYTEADWAETATKHKMSVAQAKAYARRS